jgi:sugar phosphate permease
MEDVLTNEAATEKATMRRVTLRLLPFLMLCYFFALLDRVNVGFAALQMNKDLGLSAAAFGLGSSLFFVAYFLSRFPATWRSRSSARGAGSLAS